MLRIRQKLGKYRITGRIANGPLADVYRAFDTIHKTNVALKIPKVSTDISHDDFLREVQVAARLKHANILSVQNASFIGDRFVIAMELGVESLAERINRRTSTVLALDLAGQALAALAYAHRNKIIHCDIKPENYILFPGNLVKLADFGFAKVSLRTLKASGSGTIDYIAPEQAMGRPKFQSDVFSIGLVLYRLLSGKLPEWPFRWPMIGHDRLQARAGAQLTDIMRRAIQLDPADRFKNAIQMHAAFQHASKNARRRRGPNKKTAVSSAANWRRMQWREFQRQYKAEIVTRYECRRCAGPVAESMQSCPWCGAGNPTQNSESTMPRHCPRCGRGVKLDWNYCAWCYGTGFEIETNRRYPDKRYVTHCLNKRCRQPLMAFMKYCPWCRRKVKKPWKLTASKHRCRACGWGIANEFWHFCPWCREPVQRK